jgi:GcrA cell cycle regulator
MDMAWTDERVDRLRKLWSQGLTASEIARTIGGVSRNAVIGKAHRLALPPRPSPIRRDEPHSVAPAPAGHSCMWPLGDPREQGFKFCGRPAAAGRPYCAEHCAVAYHRKDDAAA